MADTDTIVFRYYADPHRWSTYSATPRKCDLCGQVLPGYADAFFTDPDGPDIRFVCEPDLHTGRLARVGAQVNNGDRFAIAEQAATLHRDWDEERLDSYVKQRSAELEICTPSITTWQDYEWPAHCADYMRYLREIGRADCEELGQDSPGGGLGFLRRYLDPSYLQDEDDSDVEASLVELWESMRPDSPADNQDITSTSFYLFQCAECGTYLIDWDAEGIEAVGLPDADQS